MIREGAKNTPSGMCAKFGVGGDFTFQKKEGRRCRPTWKILVGVEIEDPKNGGMKMDDPKNGGEMNLVIFY